MSLAARDRVASVAGRPIPLAWVEQRLGELRRGRLGRQLPPQGAEIDRLRRWIVQELVGLLVLIHEAELAGLLPPADRGGGWPADAPQAYPVLTPELAGRLFDRATGHVAVPLADVWGYYTRNEDLYRRAEARRIRYVVAPSASLPSVLLDAPAGELASIPETGVRQGLLPALRRGELAGPIEDALFEADIGDVVGPLGFEEAWMWARIESVTPGSVASFDEVRETIEAELLAAARARAFGEWIASRQAAVAVIEPAYEHPGHPVHGLPHHRH